MLKSNKRKILFGTAIILGIALTIWFSIQPSNDRNWAQDQKVLPYAEIDNNFVTINNIRNFKYTSTTEYEEDYYDKTFDLNNIKSVDYVVEPFSEFEGSAHTFLTFGFEDDSYVSISIEIRKEQGEKFSAVKGLFKQYELMYVIADERDAIKLRSNFRKDQVFLYPIKTTKEKIQAIFLEMIEETNNIKDNPRFYNTITDTCTTKIVRHVNKVTPNKIPFSYKVILPGYSDQLVYDLGLIDTNLPFEEIRSKFIINEKALKYADSKDFSIKIRD